MKYIKTQNKYKASNLELNLDDMTAWSYGWWNFFKRIGDINVFNTYAYSTTTRRHQWKTKLILKQLGIPIDIEVDVPKGLQNHYAITDAINYYIILIDQLMTAISRPKSHSKKNLERWKEVTKLELKVNQLKNIRQKANKKREMYA